MCEFHSEQKLNTNPNFRSNWPDSDPSQLPFYNELQLFQTHLICQERLPMQNVSSDHS